jgi:MFS family permease
MRTRLSLFFGIFAVMALSNAIVPVLPSYAATSAIQAAIYSAYFLGAFVSTLPAGILSDRYGRVPVIRIGLAITVASGLLLSVLVSPVPVIVTRIMEGVGAGFFVAAAMSYVNSLPDHEQMSGYLMASLNAGLVIGLVFAGWLAVQISNPASGILVFSLLVIISAVASIFINETGTVAQKGDLKTILYLVSEFRWLWYSSVILIGITGVVATIAGVLVASRLSLPSVPAIRWSALLMVIGVSVSYYTPLGFVMLGICAGVVMIAQMTFLAQVRDHQGVAMGLFSTSSYLGMTALPFITGIIADTSGFFYAFCATALFAVTVFLTIGKCDCSQHGSL